MKGREPRALLRRQHLAHVEQHQRPHLVQLCACGLDAVHLLRDLRLVDVLIDEARQFGLVAVQFLATFAQLGECGLKDAVDAGALLGGEPEVLLELLGLPPRKRRLCAKRGGERQQEESGREPADRSGTHA